MKKTKGFSWPGGAKAAVSFSFDDARASQIKYGMPLFDRFPFKATFYVSPHSVKKDVAGWRLMVQKGHEIGNHSMTHPCSANFPWARLRGVEDYTLDRMEKNELLAANLFIQDTLGVKAKTFAYPCGHTYLGRGEAVQSYIPLVARNFLAGRGFRNEFLNDPLRCDFAHLAGTECDGLSFKGFQEFLDRATQEGSWVIFSGHEIAPKGRQTTRVRELQKILTYLVKHSRDYCVQPVVSLAEHLRKSRKTPKNG